MPTTPEYDHEEGHPVRKTLKNLKAVRAPWYFESRLRQRIQVLGSKPNRMSNAVSAFALSIAGVALVGTLAYLIFRGRVADQTMPPIDRSPTMFQEEQSPEIPAGTTESHVVSPSEGTPSTQDPMGRGPYDQQTESVKETGILNNSRRLGETGEFLPSVAPQSLITDTLIIGQTNPDSADTNRAAKDSLR